MDLELLAGIFPQIWCRLTSAFPEIWTPDNPAFGQCLGTAKIVQQYLGGEIVHMHYKPLRFNHFFNRLNNGLMVDLTSSQFSEPITHVPARIMSSSYFELLGRLYPEVAVRYNLLEARFNLVLDQINLKPS